MSKVKYLNTEECYNALLKGKTLVERRKNNTVYLENGKQVLSNKNRSKPYSFDNHNTWSVLKFKQLTLLDKIKLMLWF